MFIREFRCIGCNCVFGTLVFSASDETETVRSECGGRKPEVLFSAFGVSEAEKRVVSSSKCCSCG
jgi:hypothetical protein